MNTGYFVYILTNSTNSTFYIGVTNNLERRLYEHKNELVDGFTKKYKLKKLVYFEQFNQINDALSREKQLKNWRRDWKINLIKTINPNFLNLDPEIYSAMRPKGLEFRMTDKESQ